MFFMFICLCLYIFHAEYVQMGANVYFVAHQVSNSFRFKTEKEQKKVCCHVSALTGLVLRSCAYGTGQFHRYLSPLWQSWA